MQNEFIKYCQNISAKKELISFESSLSKIIEDSLLEVFKAELKTFIFSNPKRLRPILIFLFAKILNVKYDAAVEKIALSIELIHNASLIHDDIIDDDDKRRDNPSVHKISGIKKAILIGDMLLALALKELACTNIEIVKIISEKIEKTISGEINQNEKTGEIVPFENYIKKTYNKTGNLFMAGLLALFALNKKISQNIKNSLQVFVCNFSVAFQIKNDIENITKKDMSDIRNGNYTLAVIYFSLENFKSKEIENLKKEDLEKFILMADEKVEYYKNNAIEALENIENSKYKDDIIALCNLLF